MDRFELKVVEFGPSVKKQDSQPPKKCWEE